MSRPSVAEEWLKNVIAAKLELRRLDEARSGFDRVLHNLHQTRPMFRTEREGIVAETLETTPAESRSTFGDGPCISFRDSRLTCDQALSLAAWLVENCAPRPVELPTAIRRILLRKSEQSET